MSDDLYQEAILEAARRGAENRRLTAPDRTATVDNPLCGDRVTIDLRLADGRIAEIGFRTRGCALCQAATALIAEAAPGLAPTDAASAEAAVATMLDSDGSAPTAPWHRFAMFEPVRRHPSRHTCVLLPLQALSQAFNPRP